MVEIGKRPKEIGKKYWNMLKIMVYMMRKGVCKSKLMLDFHMLLSQGRLATKAINKLIDLHNRRGYIAALTCRSDDSRMSFISPREYEFSCSNTPVCDKSCNSSKRRNHHHHHHHQTGASRAEGFRDPERLRRQSRGISGPGIRPRDLHGGGVAAGPAERCRQTPPGGQGCGGVHQEVLQGFEEPEENSCFGNSITISQMGSIDP
ncbi:hypothetical protein F511_26968 [Dorcoceras hygrometricum]|uniref:Uncharacterized protein n=1 Tax=Dorcoceras hygrometricum TaxID=472368 RepID=A0A2Z7AUK1_9LAMI|nr:hypothetical protein F511_26968 [Dorcoceras hygrometricum]